MSAKIANVGQKSLKMTNNYKRLKREKSSNYRGLRHIAIDHRRFLRHLITRRSLVQILPPQPHRKPLLSTDKRGFLFSTETYNLHLK